MVFIHTPILRHEPVDLGCPHCGIVRVPVAGEYRGAYYDDPVHFLSLGGKPPQWIRTAVQNYGGSVGALAAMERIPLKRVYLYSVRHRLAHPTPEEQHYCHGFVVTTIDQGPGMISGERYANTYGLVAVIPNTSNPHDLRVLNVVAACVATHEYTPKGRVRKPKKPTMVQVGPVQVEVGAE